MFEKLKNYEEFVFFLRKKEFFCEKLRFFFFSSLGFEKLRVPLINFKILLKWCVRWLFEISVNGVLIFISYEWIRSSSAFVRVVGFGVGMFTLSAVLKKLWKNYIVYKFRLHKIVVQDNTESRFKTFKKNELKKRGLVEE